MKNIYLDIIEKALSAYTLERIEDFISEVLSEGLTEHGFPRLCANIGIMLAHGRKTELTELFCEMLDICCREIPVKKAANEFSVREICCCLMLLEEKRTFPAERINQWKKSIASIDDPTTCYTVVAHDTVTPLNNWAAFGAVSEFVRGKYCGIDTSEFVERQIASQIMSFDENGMYKDPNCPMVYDHVTRGLFAMLLHFGYKGTYEKVLRGYLGKSADLTLKMQSVLGELPFGGRSNQFLHTEGWVACLDEFYASEFSRQGDIEMAQKFKSAAVSARNCMLLWLNKTPIRHIKNHYDTGSMIGCEDYGYFNKYMITTASFAYCAYLMADDSVMPSVNDPKAECYTAQTSRDFHKLFISAGGYSLEYDLDADYHYDANGLGRVHKKDSPAAICLSVPLPGENAEYKTEHPNPRPMSLCCYYEDGNCILCGADKSSVYTVESTYADSDSASAEILCCLSDKMTIREKTKASASGVTIVLDSTEDCGFMVPVFSFDGSNNTSISENGNSISVEYENAVCIYSFDGTASEYGDFYNRNGKYRVYKVNSKFLHIEINERI